MISRTTDCSCWRVSCLSSTDGQLPLVNRTTGVTVSMGCNMLTSMLQSVNTNTLKNVFMIAIASLPGSSKNASNGACSE